MRKLAARLFARLPLQFRVLCRQFALRIVDLDALSIQADVLGYIGQFAGVAIMISIIHTIVAWFYFAPMPIEARIAFQCRFEQYLVATMMLAAGLFSIVSWDSTFPDRRDCMVLSPLPVPARTILGAKLATSSALLCLLVVSLNAFVGFAWPVALGSAFGFFHGFLRAFAAYWFSMIAAAVFIYSSALTIQGLVAILLPRRLALFASAVLQLAAFGLILGVYFLQGTVDSLAGLASPRHHLLLASSPSFWFFALFNQIFGVLPGNLTWLATRAWIALAISIVGALGSLLIGYRKTVRKTIEAPDLVPGAAGPHWVIRIPGKLSTAIVQFTLRTFLRSRQHRVILAFYLSVVIAIALTSVRDAIAAGALRPFTEDFPIVTSLMMGFAIVGFRNVFSLPISLNANWVLRTTQLRPSLSYISATRLTLFLLAVVPVWLISLALGLTFRPLLPVFEHLGVLALFASILVDFSLLGFHKVPCTCSYLPGNSNFQFVFWGYTGGFVLCTMLVFSVEMQTLKNGYNYVLMIACLAAIAIVLALFNHRKAKQAVLFFEELPEKEIMTLELVAPRCP